MEASRAAAILPTRRKDQISANFDLLRKRANTLACWLLSWSATLADQDIRERRFLTYQAVAVVIELLKITEWPIKGDGDVFVALVIRAAIGSTNFKPQDLEMMIQEKLQYEGMEDAVEKISNIFADVRAPEKQEAPPKVLLFEESRELPRQSEYYDESKFEEPLV